MCVSVSSLKMRELGLVKFGLRLHPLEYWALGNGKVVIGVDEVGRGSAFGPLVLAAFKLDWEIVDLVGNHPMAGKIADSKKLDHKTRARIFRHILYRERAWFVDGISNITIDKVGLGRAVLDFLPGFISRALEYLGVERNQAIIVLDGERALYYYGEESKIHYKRADSDFLSVALASIVAKYLRDYVLIKKYHHRARKYGIKNHKGYLTEVHRQAILRFGVLPEHRKSYLQDLMSI